MRIQKSGTIMGNENSQLNQGMDSETQTSHANGSAGGQETTKTKHPGHPKTPDKNHEASKNQE